LETALSSNESTDKNWLILDVKALSTDVSIDMSAPTTDALPEEEEEAVVRAIVGALQNEGISAEIRSIVEPPPPGRLGLIVPTLRLYLPLKEAGREFFGALLAAAFASAMGAPPQVAAAVLAPETAAILVRRLKGLSKEELQIVRTVALLNRQLREPVTDAQLRTAIKRDVKGDTTRLAERGILRYVGGGWFIDT
jgi:hypothetical protein